jgi:hypothetical protein
MIGEIVTDKNEKELNRKLTSSGIKNVSLKIYQSKDKTDEIAGKLSAEVKTGIIEEIYRKNEDLIKDKDQKIEFLENELLKYRKDTIPFTSIKNEIKIQYPQITKLSYGSTIRTDFKTKQDTLPVFYVTWGEKATNINTKEKTEALERWLRVRLNNEKVKVLRY